ncbi:indoleamine 2,3-dioxygenase 1 [Conger conger]|uniref:indoleamine 2,3-dioxygenase 1 n=1 Tax=Conger conger TaxID=82655 RepID=UPI002A5A7C89|nr:indoleamine 2,3-dioxygenase 1 [Conger conger]
MLFLSVVPRSATSYLVCSFGYRRHCIDTHNNSPHCSSDHQQIASSTDPMASSPTDDQPPFSLDSYHVSKQYGFMLPEPLAELPPYYQPWMDIAQCVPELIHSHALRARIHQMPQLDPMFLQKYRELRLAHLALAVMTMGYVWQEGETGIVKVLPRNLAVPIWEVSQRLGIPPIFLHGDGVLTNWRKRDPEGPFDIENMELLLSLPGGESMEGFFIVTMMVEKAAVPGLNAIPVVINGVRRGDANMVTRALEDIAQAIGSMTEKLSLMHKHVDPGTFYGTMRIFLSGWKDNPCMPEGLVYEGVQAEPVRFSGGSAAQSSFMHCFDELLGVSHEPQSGAFLTRMRDYMFPQHKRLIQDISSSPSLRQYVLNQDSDPLTTAFHRCVSQLVALRSYHINMVSRYIVVPAARARQLRAQGQGCVKNALSKAPKALEETGTGGSGIMSFLKTVRDRTKEASQPTPKADS